MKRSRLRAGAYTTQTILGRSPQPVYDEGSTRSAVRHAYGFPFSISASRHSQPESRDPASHLRIAPCTGTATKQIEFFPQPHKQHARPLPTGTAHAGGRAHGVLRREKPRLHLPRARSPTNKFRNLRCDGTRRRGVQDGVQYSIRCTTAHVRYSVRHTVHDGTCSIQRTAYSARQHVFDTVRRTVRDGT